MDYLSHNVSENLKRIRQSKGMSLDQVAEQTGVSKSMLAQIEKGTANPSLGVLGKITSGLRIEYGRVFLMRIHSRWRCIASMWNLAVYIQAEAMGRKRGNISQSLKGY